MVSEIYKNAQFFQLLAATVFFFKYIVEKHITSCSLAKLQSSNNFEITVGAAKRKELN